MAKRATREQLALGRRKGTPKQQREIKNAVLAAASRDKGSRSALRAMLAGRNCGWRWDGVRLLPSNSLLETVCAAFQERTDIPLEIPFFTTIVAVAAHALKKGAQIDLDGQIILPSPWVNILAPSGSGKSFAWSRIFHVIAKNLDLIPDSASAAKWIETLAEHNRGIYIRDEIGQFLKALDTQTYMQEIRDYLLQAYDHAPISRNLKKNPIEIECPAFCLLGFSVDETWPDCVTPEMMLDGFAQRFNYVVAERRAGEPIPLYRLGDWTKRIAEKWKEIEAVPVHPVYQITNQAQAAYEEAFRVLNRRTGDRIPMSFFRRVLFAGLPYALAYHLVLGKTTPEIDAQDVGWSARLAERHIADGSKLLENYGLSEIEKKVRQVESLVKAARSDGRPLKAREIIRRVRGVRNAVEARALLQLVIEDDPTATQDEIREANRVGRGQKARLRVVS